MTQKEHHMLCLGVLSEIHRKHNLMMSETWITKEDLDAIDQAIESAEKVLNLPISVEQLRKGLPIEK